MSLINIRSATFFVFPILVQLKELQRKQKEEKVKLAKQGEELKKLKDYIKRSQANPQQLQNESLFTNEQPTMDSENLVDVKNLEDCSPLLKFDNAPNVRNKS